MTTPVRVLIVEDNPDDLDLILGELRRAGYAPSWVRVDTEHAFLSELATSPDIILSDYSMPHFNGLRAAELVRTTGSDVPFILISGTVGEEVAVEAMRQGATDYLLKDRLGRLGNAVERALREVQAVRSSAQAQLALQQLQSQLQETLERSPTVIFSLRVDRSEMTLQMVHENITRLLGYTSLEAAAPGWWWDNLHLEDRERTVADSTRIQATDTLSLEYRLRHKAGHYLWIEDHRRVVRDIHGTPLSISGVLIDVSERRLSELALEKLRRNQDLILDAMDEGIQGIDLDGNITFENVASAGMFRSHDDERIGRSAHATTHAFRPDGSRLPESECRISATLRDGVSRRVDDEVFWRTDGTAFPVEYVVTPRLDESGAISGAVVVFHDIASRLDLEAQLRQSQKLESIGQLAGGIAHDFNNILAVIQLQAELAATVPGTPDEVQESLGGIRSAAARATDLTRQLLLFSRKQVMQPQPIELSAAVNALVKMLGRIVPEHVNLQVRTHPTPLWTFADAGMLDQVLLNLAVNASDAMPNGGQLVIETLERTVTVDQSNLDREISPGRFVVLRVSDTGTGMSAEVSSHAFEPFFTTKPPGKGTGLGLATVFGVVKQHRGWIDLYSVVGTGTTVTVYLPAYDVPELGTEPEIIASTAEPSGSSTILLAEDDASLRTLTRTVLERHGYRVLAAADGVSARALWRARDGVINLLLTDIVMPGGLDGRELAAQLQTEMPGLKVLFTSGYSADLAGRDLELAPGQQFVQKPWSTVALLHAVRTCLAH